MSIVIICGKTPEESKTYEWLWQNVKQQLLMLDAKLDIQVWPNIADYTRVTCALAWRQAAGELRKFPHLQGIFSLGAGAEHLVHDSTLPNHIPITRIVDPAMARDITQYAMTAVLNHLRRTTHWQKLQKEHRWLKQPPFQLTDKTVGIMGLGFLGSAVAKAAMALEIPTIGWRRTAKENSHNNIPCYHGDDELIPFLRATDVLICLLPHTKATEDILNKERFALLRDQAYVINIARGPLLVEKDLLTALDNGKLSGACLDVFRQEPLDEQHPFWKHPKITVTPHIAAVTNPSTIARQVLDNYYRLQKNEPLLNTVDRSSGY